MKTLNSLITSIVVATIIHMTALKSQAVTVTFDDLSGSGDLTDYMGLTFTDSHYYDKDPSLDDPAYAPSSPSERVWQDGNNNRIQFNQTVNFLGLYIAGYNVGEKIIGYSGGSQVFETTVLPSDFSQLATTINVNWMVDAISIQSDVNMYVIDDIRYETRTDNVPDAGSTLSLFGFALAGLGLLRRKLTA